LYTQSDGSSELFVPSVGEFGVPRQVRANYTTPIADQITKEAARNLIDQGKVTFQE
jgi:hypothetical protein